MHLTDEEIARRITRYEVVKRALIIFTAVAVTVMLGVLAAQGAQNSQRGKENRETLQAIRSCTQPTGQCYRDGQKRTGEAVANINQIVILAAACSVGLPPDLSIQDRQSRIQSCVTHRLAALTPKH